jgi:sugar diacid utilization regulator
MQISLNIILDALKSYCLEMHTSKDGDPSFSKCLPLPGDAQKLSNSNLYISSLSNVLALSGRSSDIYCVCVRDRIKDCNETDESLSGIIVVNENITLSDLLSLIVTRFFTITDWIQKMHEILLHNGSIQDIVDLSEPIINNYIAINDASLKLMAYTKSIPCDDPICVDLVKNGYHNDDYIKKFRKYNLFKMWDTANSVYVDYENYEMKKYPTLVKIFKVQNMYFAQVVLTCNRSSITPCLKDLFQIFLDMLAICIDRMCVDKSAYMHIYDSFILDLIDKKITNSKIIDERAQFVGLPFTGQFILFNITPCNTANLYIGKMLQEFSVMFPNFKFVRHQHRIVAVNCFMSRDINEQMQTICNLMDTFLPKYDACCGVSHFFSSMEELPYAYNQSLLAIKYAHLLKGRDIFTSKLLTDPKDSHIHFFNRNYIHCLLGESEVNAEIWYHSEYYWMLRKLYEHDKQNKSSYIELLYTYLSNSQNATYTGIALKIHRNNVVYHIERIKELLGVDLDNPSVRFIMQVSIVLVELYGFNDDP